MSMNVCRYCGEETSHLFGPHQKHEEACEHNPQRIAERERTAKEARRQQEMKDKFAAADLKRAQERAGLKSMPFPALEEAILNGREIEVTFLDGSVTVCQHVTKIVDIPETYQKWLIDGKRAVNLGLVAMIDVVEPPNPG